VAETNLNQGLPEVPVEKWAVDLVSRFANALIATCDEEINNSEDRRRVFLTFLFGAVNGIGFQQKMSPPQVHAVALAFLLKGLKLPVEESAEIAQFCINATAKGHRWNASIHEGMDEFFVWQTNPKGFKPTRLLRVLQNAPKA